MEKIVGVKLMLRMKKVIEECSIEAGTRGWLKLRGWRFKLELLTEFQKEALGKQFKLS
jgi:hypothetical protein